MRLHEYEATDIFESMGIPVPQRGVAETPEDAQRIAGEIGSPVALKAQVLAGGRGLAGGVKFASGPRETRKLSEELFGAEIQGLPVRKLLVSRRVDIVNELYAGITVDGYEGKPVVVVSSEGGVSIEEVAKDHPEKIASFHIDEDTDFFPYKAREIVSRLNIPRALNIPFANIIDRLYTVFKQFEAMIAEINPLVALTDGSLMAVDAVLDIDDSALFRMHNRFPGDIERLENPLEHKGREIGVTYVDLDGDIGIIASGAGLGMATMDIIGQRFRPANFLETGGGITEELLYKSMELVMMKKGLRAVVINIYGGINPIHEGAHGVVRYMKEHNVNIPVIAKALGNRQEETRETFRSGGVHVITDVATEKAAERLFEIINDELEL